MSIILTPTSRHKTVIRGEQHSCLAKETQVSAEGGVAVIPGQFLSTWLRLHVCATSEVSGSHHRGEEQTDLPIWGIGDVY